MKIEPKPSDREVLAGLVERVTYQNAENGFCVVRVKVRGYQARGTIAATPASMRLASDIGLRGIVLGVKRVEVLLEPLVG